MADRITVKLVRRRSRRRYVVRWDGQEKTLRAKWGDEQAAYREAFEIEVELNKQKHAMDFSEGCKLYEDWYLLHSSDKHFKAWVTAKNRFIGWCEGMPPALSEIDSRTLARFAAEISTGLSMDSVRGYCGYITGFLKWAERQQFIERAPLLSLPRRKKGSKKSKGRPLSLEEFERMLAAIPSVIKNTEWEESWEFFATGLWESSLRLGEALMLHWTNPPVKVNLGGKYPMMDFEVEADKGRQVRQLPITPGFFAMIKDNRRVGHVFRPHLRGGVSRRVDTVSKKISALGQKANIIVDKNAKTGKVKYASAHDLRRSFLERWRSKVDAAVLQVMARHESFETTKQYYLSDEAEKVAEAIWD